MNFRRILGTAAFLLLLAIAKPLSAQVITNVTPPLASHGEWVDIYGSGFAPGNRHPNTLSVDFNGTLSTTDTNAAVADWHIQITNVPPTATSGYVHVFINGSEATSPQQFVVISSNAYVTNFSLLSGGSGTPVTLTGVHFSQLGGVTNVSFNGKLSQGTPVVQDNSIAVTAPSGVTTGPLIVLSKFGPSHNFSTATNVITSATNFFVAPKITSFSPTNGRPNTNIVIKGTNFIAASAVAFGGFNALGFTVMDNNTIQATAPTNASTAAITVSPPLGTALPQAQSAINFRMLPTIYSVSPLLGPTNTLITISGAGLNEKTTHPDVTVGGATVTTFGTISPNTLTFNVPSTAASGFITITTTNGSITSDQIFYLPARITGFTPSAGAGGTIVQINGNNFTNASAVRFNGVPATSFAVTNNSVLGAIAPAGVTSGTISVTTPFGTTNSAALFYAPPTITGFTPTHGLSGTNVTVTGTSFTNATAVLFNGLPASFTVINNTTLTAVVPNDATTGKITVAAPGGTNSSAADFTIDTADVGISMSDSPDPVFIGSNLVYTIVITNGSAVSALNVQIADTLPASVQLKAATTSQGSLNTSGNPISGALGSLTNNSAATITLTVRPTATELITNAAIVTTDSLDPNSANNSAAVVTTVWPLPFLSITNLMTNGLVQISWPAPLSGFTLQFRTDLSPSFLWTNDTAPKVVSGTNVTVIETNIGTARFFRITN
jgi:uncharacterized repeat protein (TIGR01451 family)